MEITQEQERKKAQEKIRKEIWLAEMIARAKQTNPLQEDQN